MRLAEGRVSAITLDLPADVLARVQAAAQTDGDTVAEWVTCAVEQRLWLLIPPRERPAKAATHCRRCDAKRRDLRRGLCSTCAKHARYLRVGVAPRVERECPACHEVRPTHAQGLCNRCYNRARRRDLSHCRGCRTYQRPRAHGLCSTCYQRERRTVQREAGRRAG